MSSNNPFRNGGYIIQVLAAGTRPCGSRRADEFLQLNEYSIGYVNFLMSDSSEKLARYGILPRLAAVDVEGTEFAIR
jgi:hypothetical protein